MDNYTISEINNIADNQALVYHRECVLLGINKDIQIKWGYSNDGFQRMIKSLRIYMRCDLGIINYCGENKTIISNLKSIFGESFEGDKSYGSFIIIFAPSN